MVEFSEHELLAAACGGDLEATAELLVLHSRRLAQRISRRIELNPFVQFQVDDVLQEVFIDAFQGIPAFQPEGSFSFAAWLNRVCDHRLAQMLRHQNALKRGGQARYVDVESHPLRSSIRQLASLLADERCDLPSAAFARDEVVRAIVSGIQTLPDDQRVALRMHYLEGHSLSTTAARMQRTDGAIRGLLHRAKSSLRRALGRSSRWFIKK